jgi:glycosyltransferase involved in cell wall biosynthesis
VVALHDVRLAGFYRSRARVEHPEDPDRALIKRIEAMYCERLQADGLWSLAPDRLDMLGVYMTREVQDLAEGFLVHSRFAREVLELDRRPCDREVQVSVVPFGLPVTAATPRGAAAENPLIVSLGDGGDENRLATVIDAFVLLAAQIPTARLVIAEHARNLAETKRWRTYVGDRAPKATIELVVRPSAERYEELLASADLAVQLQRSTGGEASSSLADLVAQGVPTIVTELGWPGELPSAVVQKVPVNVAPRELHDHIARLLADIPSRVRLSNAALEYARSHSFAEVAEQYLDALGLQ